MWLHPLHSPAGFAPGPALVAPPAPAAPAPPLLPAPAPEPLEQAPTPGEGRKRHGGERDRQW